MWPRALPRCQPYRPLPYADKAPPPRMPPSGLSNAPITTPSLVWPPRSSNNDGRLAPCASRSVCQPAKYSLNILTVTAVSRRLPGNVPSRTQPHTPRTSQPVVQVRNLKASERGCVHCTLALSGKSLRSPLFDRRVRLFAATPKREWAPARVVGRGPINSPMTGRLRFRTGC
jgi:hypothetical protein